MSASADTPEFDQLPKRTPLYALHVAAGARMVPFAGYEMPVQYPLGVLKEHLWTREKAGLFDVSHMGQAVVASADGKSDTVAAALEALLPADLMSLAAGRQRYSQLLNDDGGIIDDLMVSRSSNAVDHSLYLVLNASRKNVDVARIAERLPPGCTLTELPAAALLALQGPAAARVLERICPAVAGMTFMESREAKIDGWIEVTITRSGYTGEDGFEISVEDAFAGALWQVLLKDPDVQPIGLGARDSLRMEAGLCLYGHELDETISPVEAGLVWSIQRRRRTEGNFPGSDRIQKELHNGPRRVRIGILPEGRAPAREGVEILSGSGETIGVVTSGGFAPSLNAPAAMGYVPPAFAAPGTPLQLVVRGKPLPAKVATLPFVPHRYVR